MRVRDQPSLWWTVLAVASGCSSPESSPPPAPPVDESATTAADVTDLAPGLPSIRSFAGDGDEPEALRKLGAVPAWNALISRDLHLSRRGDAGIVFGRLSQHDDVWFLHDESSPRMSLGYRLEPPAGAPVAAGDRVVVWGAWIVDTDNRWVWRATRLEKLEGADTPAPDRPPLSITQVEAAPADAAVPSVRDGAGPIVFVVREPPSEFGGGWLVADSAGGDRTARVLLPGDERTYGGQMPPSAGETWVLATGSMYTVEVEKFRRRDGELPVMRAISAPLEIRPPAE
jgi:hypothetical protein